MLVGGYKYIMVSYIVDTHAHLCDKVFDADREEVILRAQKAGVQAIVLVGEDLNDARRNVELSAKSSCFLQCHEPCPRSDHLFARR